MGEREAPRLRRNDVSMTDMSGVDSDPKVRHHHCSKFYAFLSCVLTSEPLIDTSWLKSRT